MFPLTHLCNHEGVDHIFPLLVSETSI